MAQRPFSFPAFAAFMGTAHERESGPFTLESLQLAETHLVAAIPALEADIAKLRELNGGLPAQPKPKKMRDGAARVDAGAPGEDATARLASRIRACTHSVWLQCWYRASSMAMYPGRPPAPGPWPTSAAAASRSAESSG
jgi:hypothetical protein